MSGGSPAPEGGRSAWRRAAGKRIAFGLAAVLACCVFSAAAFFATLTVWGLVAAPFVRLQSSSFVIACALALSGVATVAAYRAVYRSLFRSR